MKTYLLFVLIAAANSCNKANEVEAQLDGSWLWTGTHGGIGNHIHETPASTGNTVEFRFSGDRYEKFGNNKLVSRGTYRLEKKKCIHSGDEKTWIDFSGDSEPDGMIENISNNSFELSDELMDGVASSYERKN